MFQEIVQVNLSTTRLVRHWRQSQADTGECRPLGLRTHLCYPDTVKFDNNCDTFFLDLPYFVLSSCQFQTPMRKNLKIHTNIYLYLSTYPFDSYSGINIFLTNYDA